MMFTSGGQPDLLTFAGVYGGGKGGGGGTQAPAPVYVDPVNGKTFTSAPILGGGYGTSGAEELNKEIAQRQADEKTASDAATATATAKAASDEATFQGNKTGAYNTAMSDAIRAFQTAGVDPNAYMDQYITPRLQRQSAGIQDLDPNPLGAFPTSLGQDIVNQATSDKRTGLTNQFNQTFGPNYANTALPDTTAQPYISQILGEQFDPLSAQLVNAQKRGTLTGPGYDAAVAALGQKRSAATSALGDLGSNILSSERSGLNDLIGGARSDINASNLGDTTDLSGYTSRASDLASKDISGFGGALRNAVGGTQYADLTDLLNAGGAAQGPTATAQQGLAPGAMAASADALDPNATRKRGLGTVGAF